MTSVTPPYSDHRNQRDQADLDHALTIEQAAAALGCSVSTVRRNIRKGVLRAELSAGDHGLEYRVYPDQPPVLRVISDPAHDYPHEQGGEQGRDQAYQEPDQAGQPAAHPDHRHDQAAAEALIALVRELTAKNERLQDERAELYGRLGFYQAQTQQLLERIARLEAPRTPPEEAEPQRPAPPPEAPEAAAPVAPPVQRRPWWRQLLFG